VEDLAAKLFELSQAMVNDWQAFSQGRRRRKPVAGLVIECDEAPQQISTKLFLTYNGV
jgi:hypothetical protein